MRIDNLALADAAADVGDRWTLRVVAVLLDGDRTFGELAAEVDGIAPNILTARLKSLQRDGLVSARPYQRRPLRMRYALTEPGRRLGDAVALLAEWGGRRRGAPATGRHQACGTALQVRPWCPTCEVAVDVSHDDARDVMWA